MKHKIENSKIITGLIYPWAGVLLLVMATGAGATFVYMNLSGLAPSAGVNGPFTNTLGRNTFFAPGMQTWNLSLTRTLKFSERVHLQLRGELFNAFNHPNLFVAGGTNDIAAGSQVLVTRGGLPDNIGNVEQHRNIQIAVRLSF